MSKAKKFGCLFSRVATLITNIFVILRSCDVIDWPWYWIASPLIIAWGLAIVALAIGGIMGALIPKKGDSLDEVMPCTLVTSVVSKWHDNN